MGRFLRKIKEIIVFNIADKTCLIFARVKSLFSLHFPHKKKAGVILLSFVEMRGIFPSSLT